MIVRRLHDWQLTPAEASSLQLKLTTRVSPEGNMDTPRYVAGVDVRSPVYATGKGIAAVVLLSYPQLATVEISLAAGEITFPYVPGLLSFRELPLVTQAFEKLTLAPDLVIVDGQGIAHPRRFGIASHLGLLLDVPTIGCAKSRLVGTYTEPVFVSVGHKISLDQALGWVIACCQGYRLPEPVRLAHRAASGQARQTPAIMNS
jgi:deoxyribonuclease V